MPSLPIFKSVRSRRKDTGRVSPRSRNSAMLEEEHSSDRTRSPAQKPAGEDLKRATRAQKRAIAISSFCFLVSFIFLVLVTVGNTYNKPVLRDTFFFKLDLSNVFAQAISGDIAFTNSIARSLGLHDFYQIGLWTFCEGYNDSGISSCTHPSPFYWFDPVSIILDELLPGATISLPTGVVTILHIVRITSNVMFICFLLSAIFAFLAVFLAPLILCSYRFASPLVIFAIAMLFVVLATSVATAMFTIFRDVFTSQKELQIQAEVGTQMLVFMWLATGFVIVAASLQIKLGCTCCCCCRRKGYGKTRLKMGDRFADTAEEAVDGERGGRKEQCGSRCVMNMYWELFGQN